MILKSGKSKTPNPKEACLTFLHILISRNCFEFRILRHRSGQVSCFEFFVLGALCPSTVLRVVLRQKLRMVSENGTMSLPFETLRAVSQFERSNHAVARDTVFPSCVSKTGDGITDKRWQRGVRKHEKLFTAHGEMPATERVSYLLDRLRLGSRS